MDDWFDTYANTFHIDFDLFSTFEDALNDENPWTFCNFNHHGVGCKFWYLMLQFIPCHYEILTWMFGV